jgi:hypothetical protein
MNRIPFSVYDFFGYLISGFLLLVAIDYAGGYRFLLRNELSLTYGIFWTVIAYITGQILAGPSAWLLERIVIGRWLKRPNINLFKDPPQKFWVKIFPGYFTPFPPEIRKSILAKARIAGIEEVGEALFLHSFAKVKIDNDTMARLNTFLYLYGFCRNISFTCFVSAFIIAFWSIFLHTPEKLLWAFIAITFSVGMFFRYLKFFRQYSYELFLTYSELSQRE